MELLSQIDMTSATRDLIRLMRMPPDSAVQMPESAVWKAYIELRRRAEPGAAGYFMQGLKGLHRRRTMGIGELCVVDNDADEHRLVEDPYIGELWRSYKRCLCANRTGPASQILRELEQQLNVS